MTTVTFVGAGKYSDVFKVSARGKTVIMKLSYYRDTTWSDFVKKMRLGDVDGARKTKNRDAIMVAAAFANATNELVMRGISPHFVVVYCHADCRDVAPKLKALIQERVKSSTKVQMKLNNACFMEVFSGDMTKWLRGRSVLTDASVRAAIFGVVYTLAAVQRVYPGFRHNDLSTNNVLIKKLRRPMRASYAIDGRTFYVTAPVLAAISDYDFTHVPGHAKLSNERVIGGRYRVTAAPNPTYDTHFFLKSVLKSLHGKFKRPGALPETQRFLRSLPLNMLEDRLDTQPVAGIAPAELLGHAYFGPLLQRPATANVDAAYAAPNAATSLAAPNATST